MFASEISSAHCIEKAGTDRLQKPGDAPMLRLQRRSEASGERLDGDVAEAEWETVIIP
jgi:hypothetical protein